MAEDKREIWDLWYPKAGATGIPFARCRIDPADIVLVHAAPPHLSVQVRRNTGELLAEGLNMAATDDTPIARLYRGDVSICMDNVWPGAEDIGRVVILAGGEAGILKEWWNEPDHSAWRWAVEFFNHR
jgi:hypothetical protein